jgi:hypothetical protein
MTALVFKAFVRLMMFEYYLLPGDFPALYAKVRTCPVNGRWTENITEAQICRAVDIACIVYFKEVLCLQRSATTAFLLKRNGVKAELVIGTQQMPFKAHAWVEIGGRVVNDKPYTPEMYNVLDRC